MKSKEIEGPVLQECKNGGTKLTKDYKTFVPKRPPHNS
jgi:hypothetical protein